MGWEQPRNTSHTLVEKSKTISFKEKENPSKKVVEKNSAELHLNESQLSS
jgi:hypothetical protein